MRRGHTHDPLPVVYSCSGCSSAAQMANHIAVRLDREGCAEMSCIAGLGGDVPSLVRKAREAVAGGRAILAIDGCVLSCARQTLARHGIVPTRHVELWRMGVPKRQHEDFDAQQADALLARCREISAGLPAGRAAGRAAAAGPAPTPEAGAPQAGLRPAPCDSPDAAPAGPGRR